jgi:hypothetical protein
VAKGGWTRRLAESRSRLTGRSLYPHSSCGTSLLLNRGIQITTPTVLLTLECGPWHERSIRIDMYEVIPSEIIL